MNPKSLWLFHLPKFKENKTLDTSHDALLILHAAPHEQRCTVCQCLADIPNIIIIISVVVGMYLYQKLSLGKWQKFTWNILYHSQYSCWLQHHCEIPPLILNNSNLDSRALGSVLSTLAINGMILPSCFRIFSISRRNSDIFWQYFVLFSLCFLPLQPHLRSGDTSYPSLL